MAEPGVMFTVDLFPLLFVRIVAEILLADEPRALNEWEAPSADVFDLIILWL